MAGVLLTYKKEQGTMINEPFVICFEFVFASLSLLNINNQNYEISKNICLINGCIPAFIM